jgi:tRNA pseudouridine38-40 synthase
MKVRLHISYDGTDFLGWQRQKTSTNTVQGVIESALSRLFDSQVNIVGSGRTDAGVHALHQVAHFKAPKDPSNYKFVRALNKLTPISVSIKEAFLAPDDFHAQNSATHKTYKYRILNRETPSAVRSRYTTWIQNPIDLEFLNKATQHIIGEQDFASFQSSGTETITSVRTILEAKWELLEHETLEFTITGTGFLKQMVRKP